MVEQLGTVIGGIVLLWLVVKFLCPNREYHNERDYQKFANDPKTRAMMKKYGYRTAQELLDNTTYKGRK